jgi:RNA polymerase sigma-70 factor (ECF subfamily)
MKVQDNDSTSRKKTIPLVVTDAALEALRAGDREVFDDIYLRFSPPVKIFLRALLGSAALADDACQELFSRVWQHRQEIDSDKNFRSFLYTAAKNICMTYFRERRARDTYSHAIPPDDERDDTPHDIVSARETELLIKLLVSRMPARRREIFTMSRFEGKSNEEIAALLHVKKNAVEKQLSFAMKEIRRALS